MSENSFLKLLLLLFMWLFFIQDQGAWVYEVLENE